MRVFRRRGKLLAINICLVIVTSLAITYFNFNRLRQRLPVIDKEATYKQDAINEFRKQAETLGPNLEAKNLFHRLYQEFYEVNM